MKILVRFALIILCSLISFQAFSAPAVAELEGLWQQSKGKAGYANYQTEFVQYNNYLHLDTKDGCIGLAPGKLSIYLVVNAHAVVESVITDFDNPKAQCFKRTYAGLTVKAPPFSPLIIKMIMEDKPR